MKVAIIHEMLIKLGGAEKVVESLLKIFPKADLFTLIYNEKKVGPVFKKESINKQVFGLKTQKIYNLFKNQRLCLPFMPYSVESLDFSKYDLVISSSSGFAHGVITKPETKIVVYSHSPTRYMWDWTNEYKKDIGWNSGLKGYLLNKTFLKLRQWDYLASSRADIILANSNNTSNRIKKYHRKNSSILYPPVETNRFSKKIEKNLGLLKKYNLVENNYYIIISALVEFKKIDIAIKSFNKIGDKKLLIIGDGSHRKYLESISETNIIFCGAQYHDNLVSLVQSTLGLIFPGEEDFGIVPIEVMAAGKPIFALKKGGLCETVIEGVTGEFFDNKEGSDFIEKFYLFHKNNLNKKYKKKTCRLQAEKFSEENFEKKLLKLLKLLKI